ncbi:hypothetical protein O6H91_14G028800 [Diphasiastrum complanatum]|uniref:Uncharacterized protein n=1 Tax=Diphasiastrum complanatum TaxID=34168 RepID=A0ACC2BMM7_DIPCM|nr:hypothetical protein O6H91_14G028800 [Diphasiastrum complanatum]
MISSPFAKIEVKDQHSFLVLFLFITWLVSSSNFENNSKGFGEHGFIMERDAAKQLNLLPGFRFHPTDEELVVHYLSAKAAARPFPIPIIAELDLYKFDPWDLPKRALFGEREWYFFSPRDRKYPNGARPNRAAASGYWKATGIDKPILRSSGCVQTVGVKKALVFYKGKAPRGIKTNWIMHEYRLTDSAGKPSNSRKKGSLRLDDWVLCRIYNRNVGTQKVMLPEHQMSCSNYGRMLKEDVEDQEPSIDDMMALLPDIDESKLFLPRLSSLRAFIQGEDHPQRNFHHERTSENGSKTALCQVNLRYSQSNLQDSYNSESDQQQDSELQCSAKLTTAITDLDLEGISKLYPVSDLRAQARHLKRPPGLVCPRIDLQSVKERESFNVATDELQSTSRHSPIFPTQSQPENINELPSSSTGTLLLPETIAHSKTECENNFFARLNEFFSGHSS